MTVLISERDADAALSGPHARRAMATAMQRTTLCLSGAEPVDDERTAPLVGDLRIALAAVERCPDRGVQRAVAAARAACAYLSAGRAEDAFLALEDARERLGRA